MQGLYVVIEGIEGSGKTTHSRMLYKHLEGKGYSPIMVREPGGTPLGQKVRELLLTAEMDLVPVEELLLFSLARSALRRMVIKPAVDGGMIVISDRNYWSSRVYQAAARGLSDKLVVSITDAVMGETKPDLTIFLDAPLEVSTPIRQSRKDERFKREQEEFFRKVHAGYQTLKPLADLVVSYRAEEEMQREIQLAVEHQITQKGITQNP